MKRFFENQMKLLLLFAAAGLFVFACEHEKSVNAPANGGDNPLDPTFSNIQSTILSRKCAVPGCHAGSSPSGGLNLSAGQAYGNLVNVNSNYGVARITPNDPGNSVLYQKVIGNNQFGSKMPLGGSLSQTEMDLILAWINAGAPNN